MTTTYKTAKSWLVIGLASVIATQVIGADSVAMQALRYDDQDRSTPRPTDNADVDPQPYYVDGVQYKPYVNDKKKKTTKAPEVTSSPAAAQVATPTLKPYVPNAADLPAKPDTSSSQPKNKDVADNAAAYEANATSRAASSQSSSYARASNSSSASDPGPVTKRPRYGSAVIQSLDKVTAETVRFEVPIGKPIRYKGLIYTVKACETTAPDEAPQDVIAYLQVRTSPTITPNMVDPPKSKEIFSGWSFASSPGINPLQHPIYDAWVIGCRNPIT